MTVKIPSIIESGTCVMAKIPRNFHAAPITPVTVSGVDNSKLERGDDIGCHRSAEGCDEDDQTLW